MDEWKVVGIISKTAHDSEKMLEAIVKNDNADWVRKSRACAFMEDRTLYVAINDPLSLRGRRLTQLIVDSGRIADYSFDWDKLERRYELMAQARIVLSPSCVPDEFLIQEYEY